MKYIITESQKHNIIKDLIRNEGVNIAIELVGLDFLVNNVFNNDPLEFLEVYNGMDKVILMNNEEKIPTYRFRPGYNILMHFSDRVYLHEDVWGVLSEGFGLSHELITTMIKDWSLTSYKLKGKYNPLANNWKYFMSVT